MSFIFSLQRCEEVRLSLERINTNDDLAMFIEGAKTGTEKPGD